MQRTDQEDHILPDRGNLYPVDFWEYLMSEANRTTNGAVNMDFELAQKVLKALEVEVKDEIGEDFNLINTKLVAKALVTRSSLGSELSDVSHSILSSLADVTTDHSGREAA